MREKFEADFAAWWEEHGQYLRAGGGQYEITFAYEAAKHFYAAGMERAAEICDHPDAIDADDCAALIRYEITKESA